MKFFNKKIFLLAALAFSVFLILVPAHFAHAGLFNLGNLAFSVVGKLIYGITWILTAIGGILVAIAAWLVSIFLQANTGLVNSDVVQYGFPVTLAIANMGFVLAIIVIAIATILRQQSYGIKSLLAKVVMMAVLVNFGLILAGGILNFSDTLSNSFLEGISPAGNGSSFTKFASSLTGAFNPQKSFISDVNQAQTTSDASAAALAGSTLGAMIVPIFSTVFALGSLVILLVTLLALVIMLLIRYVTLGILLVLLPIAWMMFVFPSLKKHYDEWWSVFLKNAFFPPIVLFFLWLGLKVADAMSSGAGGTLKIASYTSTSNNPIAKVISDLIGSAFTTVVTGFLQTLIVGGLFIGGLFAAQKMGVSFASAGMGALKGGGKAAGKWASSRAVRGASRAATRNAPVQHPTGEGVSAPMKVLNKARNFINRGTFAAGTPVRYAARATGLAERLPTAGEDQEKINMANEDLARLKKERLALRLKFNRTPAMPTVPYGAPPDLTPGEALPSLTPGEALPALPTEPGTPQPAPTTDWLPIDESMANLPPPLPGTPQPAPTLGTPTVPVILPGTPAAPPAASTASAAGALPSLTPGTPPALPGTPLSTPEALNAERRKNAMKLVLQVRAKNDEIKKAKEIAGGGAEKRGLAVSVLLGMKDGSGLFKKMKSKETEAKTREEWKALGYSEEQIDELDEKYGLVKKEKKKEEKKEDKK